MNRTLTIFFQCRDARNGIPGVIFLCALLLGSCREPQGSDPAYSEYLDSLINQSGSLYAPQMDHSSRKVDSAYFSLPNPTITDLCKRYLFKSAYFFHYNNPSRAILYADSVIRLMNKTSLGPEQTPIYAEAYLRVGDALLQQMDFNNALRYFYEGRKIIDITGDICLFGQYSIRIATICYKQEKYADAAKYYQQAVEELLHCPDKNRLDRFLDVQGNMDNVGLSYDKQGKTDSALRYYRKALEYIDQNSHRFPQEKISMEIAKGVIYGNLATTLYKKGDIKETERLFKKSIEINIQAGHENGDARITQLKLAELYLQTDRLPEALSVLDSIQPALKDSSAFTKALRAKWYRLQAEYYSRLQQPAAAFSYLSTYIALKDAIEADQRNISGINLNEKFEHFDSEQTLALLRKNNELKTTYLRIAIIIGIIAIGVIFLIWRNRKNLKLLNEKIRKQNRHMQLTLSALEESQEDNTRMMKIVAHDLRNPVGGMGSLTELLLHNKALPEDDQMMLRMIRASGQHALELIDNLLQVRVKGEALKKEPVDLGELLRYCVSLLVPKAKEKEQELILTGDSIIIQGNREKLWRVASNLIGNAIKFSTEGKTIEIHLEQQEQKVLFSVKDAGIGIPEEKEGEIFEMFGDARRLGTKGEHSFGMGLAICKEIVEAHEGDIWFENNDEMGTTFYVELPVNGVE